MTIFSINVQSETHCPCCTLFECTDDELTYWLMSDGDTYTLDYADPRTHDDDRPPMDEFGSFEDALTKLYELFGY